MMLPFNLKEALKSGVYISGTTGTGKSDVGMYIAEELMNKGTTVLVFDPSQDWIHRSSIPHYRSKEHGYLFHPKLNPKQNMIFDLSRLTPKQQQIAVEEFCKIIMKEQADIPKHERQQYFIIFEEAHTYFPQGCMLAKRNQNAVFMMTQGRNYKVRFACVTQFAAMIDKNAMRYMKQRYFGSTDEPNDMEYIQRFFPKKNREDINVTLGSLQAGQFIYKHGKHNELIQIEPFEATTKPQQTDYRTTTTERATTSNNLKEKTKHEPTTHKELISLAAALFWIFVILLALKPLG